MNNKKKFKLKLMYWYNILVTGGFALLIAVMFFIPNLRDLLAWKGADPIVVSLVVPLFIVMAVFSALSLSNPASGILLLKIQIFYKPFAITFIIYFTIVQKIHILWAIIIITGLLLYIIGNIWAIYEKNQN